MAASVKFCVSAGSILQKKDLQSFENLQLKEQTQAKFTAKLSKLALLIEHSKRCCDCLYSRSSTASIADLCHCDVKFDQQHYKQCMVSKCKIVLALEQGSFSSGTNLKVSPQILFGSDKHCAGSVVHCFPFGEEGS